MRAVASSYHDDGPFQPRGLWQDIPMDPPDYDKMRADLENATPEERIVAAQRYMQSRLVAGPPSYPPPGVYDQMISRETDGSDPLVPEPGP
jgi:hypothetical protein